MNSAQETRKTHRSFIGMIKFYDSKKEFGYIASNNCGMHTHTYNQDFYVDRSSFLDYTAKKEGCIVVFEYEVTPNKRTKAINVRQYSNALQDNILLGLTYYGEHELITIDKKEYNIFNQLNIASYLCVKLLIKNMKEDPSRSPETTLKHFDFFLTHYRSYKYLDSEHYVYSQDMRTDLGAKAWHEFVTNLHESELFMILNSYPSFCDCVEDNNVIEKWGEQTSFNSVKAEVFYKYFDKITSRLSLSCQEIAKKRIDQIIRDEIEAYSKKSMTFFEYKKEKPLEQLRLNISHLLKIAGHDFSKEMKECDTAIRVNVFHSTLEKTNLSTLYLVDELQTTFSDLLQQEKFFDEFANAISKPIERYFKSELKIYGSLKDIQAALNPKHTKLVYAISPKIYDLVIPDLEKEFCKLVGKGDKAELSSKLKFKPIIEYIFTDNSPKVFEFESQFGKIANLLSEPYKEKLRFTFAQKFKERIAKTSDLLILEYAVSSVHHWITVEEYYQRHKEIASTVSIEEIVRYINQQSYIPRKNCDLSEENVVLAFNVLEKNSLEDFWKLFSTQDKCSFDNELKHCCTTPLLQKKWEHYLNSLPYNEIEELYFYHTITTLPEEVLIHIVQSLTLEDFITMPESWYIAPSLKDPRLNELFSDPSINTFTPITIYLSGTKITDENIPLTVAIIELLSANKPKDQKGTTYKNWEIHFQKQLQKYANEHPDNKRVLALLWAVYLNNKASKDTLSTMFGYLPPYLQIKCVKKLFQLIADKKITFTISELNNFLRRGEHQLCLAVEILLSYLINREKNKEFFNTNHMLNLLDERIDHNEWIGIREFVITCQGRVTLDSNTLYETHYYNGTIKNASVGIYELYLPKNKIDMKKNILQDSNKYYTILNQIIPMTFKIHFTEKRNDGELYYLKNPDIRDLLNFALTFRIEFEGHTTNYQTSTQQEYDENFCECRISDKLSLTTNMPFYWCNNKPCFFNTVRFHGSSEWEHYTILDFMRIMGIQTDYITAKGNIVRYGQFSIFSSFLKSFANLYAHLICHECGKIMKPVTLTNFAARAVNEYSCHNESCSQQNIPIYLNHCFNKSTCKTIIDSRETKQCPNEQYICPKCGACCSTQNFRNHIQHLKETGGYISRKLYHFVDNDLGHWEKEERFCYKCGKQMTKTDNKYFCKDCNTIY
jgi:cold shock CspA family protein